MKISGRNLWYWTCKYVFIALPASTFSKFAFFINCIRLKHPYYSFNLKSPKTFNEKLNYLKLNDRNPLAPVVGDKVKVRDYVRDTVGDKYLIPSIGVFDNASKIDVNALPQRFALKTNHGSGWNLIVKDKSLLNWEVEKRQLNRWLNKNSFYLNREWHYKKITPLLLCEELLEFEIKDYKFFCSMGKPKLVQVDSDRFSNHQRAMYTADTWQECKIQIRYAKSNNPIPKPKLLEEMVAISSKLAQPFVFCRVDLYEHNGKVFFGEITLHPGGGIEPFLNREMDLEMGHLIDLN
jgi:hypothetical protein